MKSSSAELRPFLLLPSLGRAVVHELRRQPPILPFIMLIVFLGLFLRLLGLQLVAGARLELLAEGNRLRSLPLLAPRGELIDRRGVPLVTNTAGFQLILRPRDLPSGEAGSGVLQAVSAITGVRETETRALVSRGANQEFLLIGQPMSLKKAQEVKLRLQELPGVSLLISPGRSYPEDLGLSSLLGAIGRPDARDLAKGRNPIEWVGTSGLEARYEAKLKGTIGAEETEVTAKSEVVRLVGRRAPVPGTPLRLTLDRSLQEIASKALRSGMAGVSERGVVVGLDPRSGAIRALVSLPEVSSNTLSGGVSSAEYEAIRQDERSPLINRAFQGEYPAGSIVKPLIASAALETGLIEASTALEDRGVLRIPSAVEPGAFAEFYGYNRTGLGRVDLKKAIALSSDIYFYIIGGGFGERRGLGLEGLRKAFLRFGLGEQTGLSLPGEAGGLVPSNEWKERNKGERWFLGDTYHLSIGQGDLLVTPLQIARSIAAIANGGKLLTPLLTEGEQSKSQVVSISPRHLETIREAMRATVTTGTARRLSTLPISVAGKTGTAETGKVHAPHAWLVSFAPYDDPKLVLVVLVEGGGEGSSRAVPIAKTIYEEYLKAQPVNDW